MILEQMKTCMYEHRRFKELLKRLYVAVTIMNYGIDIIATVKFKSSTGRNNYFTEATVVKTTSVILMQIQQELSSG